MDYKEKIADTILKNNIIEKDKVEKLLKESEDTGKQFIEVLASSGYISEKDFFIILAKDLGLPVIPLAKINIPKEIISLLPREYALKYKIVPIGKVGNSLTVSFPLPPDVVLIDDLERITNCEIAPVLSYKKDIEDAVNKYYIQESIENIETILQDVANADLEVVKEEEKDAVSVNLDVKSIEEAPVVKAANFILSSAVLKGASDILIEPLSSKIRVRYKIDGIWQEADTPSAGVFSLVVSRIKVMANLDIAEHRLPQDGRFRMNIHGREVDFRVSIVPSILGEKASLRILDKSTAVTDLSALGFSDEVVEKLKDISGKSYGMIIACGPTGSGKTTTLYSILNYIYSPAKNIITVEDPIEYELKGINQVNVNTEVGLTFASSLRSILRQDPDVIMVGEIRDIETVDIAIKAALTGHLVLSTLHTTTAVGSVVRLINMGVEPFLITSSLIGVIAQRLVRKLCDKCKEPYSPMPEALQALGINKEKIKGAKFYRAKGCKECFFSGYKGRIGICELLVLDEEIKELILNNASESEVERKAREKGMHSFLDDAVSKLLQGETSLEEVLRVAGGRQAWD